MSTRQSLIYDMTMREWMDTKLDTIYYYFRRTDPKHRGREYNSMSQVGARVNRYKQVITEVVESD